MSKFSFPTAFTILFALIVVVAGMTWVVPAGQFDRVMNEELGKEVPVPGTFKEVEPNPQGIADIFLAPVNGFYDIGSYEANAIDVALFVLFIGGFIAVVNKTGAVDAGIYRVMIALRGREIWMIPILMALFAAGGTIYGMAEETIAFYMIIIPVMMRAGYDALTGVAVILIGAGIGTLGSTVNPFATVIAANAADVPFTDGIGLRVVILLAGWLICVYWVMRYAAKVKADHTASLVADRHESNIEFFLGGKGGDDEELPEMTTTRGLVLLIFLGAFGVMIYGVSALGWWMGEMSGLFLASSMLVALVARMGEREFTDTFVDGARDLLGVALIIAIARGVVIVMNDGLITDTILQWSSEQVAGLSQIAFINVMFWLEIIMSFLVPSSSGLAVLSMPILAPLGDFSDVNRALIVTAYQSASGWVNLVTPTSGVVMGALAIGRVRYDIWLRFMWPLLIMLAVMIMIVLSVGAL